MSHKQTKNLFTILKKFHMIIISSPLYSPKLKTNSVLTVEEEEYRNKNGVKHGQSFDITPTKLETILKKSKWNPKTKILREIQK